MSLLYHNRGALCRSGRRQRWFDEPFLLAVSLGGRRKSPDLLSQIASSAVAEPHAVFS